MDTAQVAVTQSLWERIISLLRPRRTEPKLPPVSPVPHTVEIPAQLESRALLEKWGFQMSENVERPNLVSVRLPKGWTARDGDIAGWSIISDRQARERLKVFSLKTESYSKQSLRVLRRIETRICRVGESVQGEVLARNKGGMVVIYRTAPHTPPLEDLPKGYKATREDISEWLQANLPKWQDPDQYWELDFVPTPESG